MFGEVWHLDGMEGWMDRPRCLRNIATATPMSVRATSVLPVCAGSGMSKSSCFTSMSTALRRSGLQDAASSDGSECGSEPLQKKGNNPPMWACEQNPVDWKESANKSTLKTTGYVPTYASAQSSHVRSIPPAPGLRPILKPRISKLPTTSKMLS
ncbi:hypothetical protein BU26DRAFT_573618 [Trematosphaeria pertusa]|uniref:Uncharacterized protein n=1 Tax=Trematosphaeria pertusa TaxID=390896 RepID=A0A6A6J0Y4_9PLEO|nr:uncharacterized protein BU26DRAFT_573618 [Trematosphaeria pertusa]KAF2255832.1 hypothetical protein BU26DRAFT_573618 [Trematosphaeria pertusa]